MISCNRRAGGGRQMENPAGGGITASRHRRFILADGKDIKANFTINTLLLCLSTMNLSSQSNRKRMRTFLRLSLSTQCGPPFSNVHYVHSHISFYLSWSRTLAAHFTHSTGTSCVAAMCTGWRLNSLYQLFEKLAASSISQHIRCRNER